MDLPFDTILWNVVVIEEDIGEARNEEEGQGSRCEEEESQVGFLRRSRDGSAKGDECCVLSRSECEDCQQGEIGLEGVQELPRPSLRLAFSSPPSRHGHLGPGYSV